MISAMGADMRSTKLTILAMTAAVFFAGSGESQPAPVPVAPYYADIADLALPAPVAAHVRIASAVRLKDGDAAGVPAGSSRFYIESDVISLIKGTRGLPARIRYLIDLPNQPNGKPAKIAKKAEYLLFASPLADRPGEVRLIARDAHWPWSETLGSRTRAILTEASRTGAAPQIKGIGRAFHVPGTLPGESETQIFLQAADGRPVSLSILRRPNQTPRWAVSLTEIVDDSAAAPQKDTLLWYRLACTLPARLPQPSFAEASAGEITAIEADYRLVRDSLGPCARSRTR
jgi:hypothetical protein